MKHIVKQWCSEIGNEYVLYPSGYTGYCREDCSFNIDDSTEFVNDLRYKSSQKFRHFGDLINLCVPFVHTHPHGCAGPKFLGYLNGSQSHRQTKYPRIFVYEFFIPMLMLGLDRNDSTRSQIEQIVRMMATMATMATHPWYPSYVFGRSLIVDEQTAFWLSGKENSTGYRDYVFRPMNNYVCQYDLHDLYELWQEFGIEMGQQYFIMRYVCGRQKRIKTQKQKRYDKGEIPMGMLMDVDKKLHQEVVRVIGYKSGAVNHRFTIQVDTQSGYSRIWWMKRISNWIRYLGRIPSSVKQWPHELCPYIPGLLNRSREYRRLGETLQSELVRSGKKQIRHIDL